MRSSFEWHISRSDSHRSSGSFARSKQKEQHLPIEHSARSTGAAEVHLSRESLPRFDRLKLVCKRIGVNGGLNTSFLGEISQEV